MPLAAGIINLTEAARSVELLKINGHSATAERPECSIASRRTTVGGLYWVIDYYPSVHDYYDKQNWIMIRITLASDATGVVASFACRVVDQAGSLAPSTTAAATGKLGKGGGKDILVMSRPYLANSGYLKDDSFLLECVITVLLDEQTKSASEKAPEAAAAAVVSAAPPMMSDLHKHFGELWRSQRGTDVTFLVAGEPVAAHKCVLAARSPVFMAELFGDMKETASQSVVIEDMELEVFRALMRFIYTDTSPPELEEGQEEDGAMAQHLLAAADRYGMAKLKLMCEEKVCGDISVGTVATLLVLAEQHGCPRLKAMCMEFIVATPANLRAVVATDGYNNHLMASCPSVLSDLLVAVVQRNK
ncbi:unnamed protein product [Urochloa decumbens]|uniref:BTB domain-containing protein n=1 Tax=Urochloa decumbens TaxID=240449 RepID=A0ABC9E1J2_9POAL